MRIENKNKSSDDEKKRKYKIVFQRKEAVCATSAHTKKVGWWMESKAKKWAGHGFFFFFFLFSFFLSRGAQGASFELTVDRSMSSLDPTASTGSIRVGSVSDSLRLFIDNSMIEVWRREQRKKKKKRKGERKKKRRKKEKGFNMRVVILFPAGFFSFSHFFAGNLFFFFLSFARWQVYSGDGRSAASFRVYPTQPNATLVWPARIHRAQQKMITTSVSFVSPSCFSFGVVAVEQITIEAVNTTLAAVDVMAYGMMAASNTTSL